METRPLSYACVVALALMTTPVSADVRLSNDQILAHVIFHIPLANKIPIAVTTFERTVWAEISSCLLQLRGDNLQCVATDMSEDLVV